MPVVSPKVLGEASLRFGERSVASTPKYTLGLDETQMHHLHWSSLLAVNKSKAYSNPIEPRRAVLPVRRAACGVETELADTQRETRTPCIH